MEEEPTGSMWDKLLNAISDQGKTVLNAIEGLRKSVEKGFRKGTYLATIGIIIGILGLVFVVLPLRKGVNKIESGVSEVGSRVERVEKGIQAREFKITSPADGAIVDRIALIRGKTPFPEMNHYVVVTPVKTKEDWVEDGPVRVSASGLWDTQATFGSAAVGAGEQFIVRALATKSILSPGPLTEVPKDAIFSESITVTRSK